MTNKLQILTEIVGADSLLSEHSQTVAYCIDWRKRYQGKALAVAFPHSREQVVQLVKCCQAKRIPIVPQGGNTSTCGAATPDASGKSLVINLKRMRKIQSIDTINNSISVEAGVILAEVQQAAKRVDRLFPLALASQGSCQIGGNLSTNAGGMAVLRYGTMRDLTLGLEAVLPDGSIFNALSALRKDTSGLDLKHLFIGAEGTLGIITAATLKLFPLPHAHATAFVGLASIDKALLCLNELKQMFGQTLTAVELISQACIELVTAYRPELKIPFVAPWAMLIELSDNDNEYELQQSLLNWLAIRQDLLDGIIAKSESERSTLWALREYISDAQKSAGFNIKHDIAVPLSKLAEFMQRSMTKLQQTYPNVKLIIFGHIGDGSLHYNVSQTSVDANSIVDDEKNVNKIVYDIVYSCGGTLAAEHGIGQLKSEWLACYKDPVAMNLMRKIKSHLDPQDLFNSKKIY